LEQAADALMQKPRAVTRIARMRVDDHLGLHAELFEIDFELLHALLEGAERHHAGAQCWLFAFTEMCLATLRLTTTWHLL
jgi:hypothetical protein